MKEEANRKGVGAKNARYRRHLSLVPFLYNFEVLIFGLCPFLMGNLNIPCEQALHLGDCKMTYYVSGT